MMASTSEARPASPPQRISWPSLTLIVSSSKVSHRPIRLDSCGRQPCCHGAEGPRLPEMKGRRVASISADVDIPAGGAEGVLDEAVHQPATDASVTARPD